MTAAPRTTGSRSGLTPFRLADVPPAIRESAKSRLVKLSDSITERIQIGIAADAPSDRVYWIPTTAWEDAARKTACLAPAPVRYPPPPAPRWVGLPLLPTQPPGGLLRVLAGSGASAAPTASFHLRRSWTVKSL